MFGVKLNFSHYILFWSVSRAGQWFVSRVDPGLSWLDCAGDQEDGVLPRIVLPVEGHTLRQHKRIITKGTTLHFSDIKHAT